MSVLRKYNPTTEQWEVLQGGVQGLQGPPVALSKGTVTTGAPGSNANFTVTGTPPNQKLNLTIPRGDVGPTGPTFGSDGSIIAAGRPDLPDTMDTATQAEVLSASPGTLFRSTDGAGVGAWMWMKQGTKWAVTDGDTGWRVCSTMLPETAKDSGFWLRRVGPTVYARFSTPFSGTRPDANVLITWPLTPARGSGFHPSEPTSTGSTSARYMTTVSALLQGRVDHFTGSNWVGQFGITWDSGDPNISAKFGAKTNSTAAWGGATINYPTADPWPTILPGTPA